MEWISESKTCNIWHEANLIGDDTVTRLSIQTQELNDVLHHLFRALDVRITLFDADDRELDLFDIKPMAPYCRMQRKELSFRKACTRCDAMHLSKARSDRRPHLYQCHSGLLEGVVPLRSGEGIYLGSVLFGQMRLEGTSPPPGMKRTLLKHYRMLPCCSWERAEHLAALIQYVSEYIIEQELLRRNEPSWVEALRRYIDRNYHKPLQLADLAESVGKSRSFLSHRFRDFFGQPPMQYIHRRRMEKARALLGEGQSVRQTAEDLGFCDAFYFSRSFKAWFGQPPSAMKPNTQR